MDEKIKIQLGPIQKTLLIPLWARAVEYDKKNPIISDRFAHEIVSHLDFDFGQLAVEMTDVVQVNCAIRAYHIDNELQRLIKTHPDATIINIGAGLDTTFHRLDNGQIHWYELDMPDSIALRKKLIAETERNEYITASAFDKDWYSQIKHRGSKVIFIAAGVLVYFPEEKVKQLFLSLAEEFPGSHIIFEIYSKQLLAIRRRVLANRGRQAAMLQQMQWGIRSGKLIEKWSRNLHLVEQYNFYSRVPVTDENRKIIKQFFLLNLFGMFRIVHMQLGK